jgi:hypothetical protein
MIGRAKFRPHELRGVKPKIYKAAFFDAIGHPHPCQGNPRVPVTHSYYAAFRRGFIR